MRAVPEIVATDEGESMMMGLGFWIMLAVLSVPILLILSLILLIIKPLLIGTGALTESGPMNTTSRASWSTCSRCGARLLPEWLHCPQCGAPASG
jgi:hypothetical protein